MTQRPTTDTPSFSRSMPRLFAALLCLFSLLYAAPGARAAGLTVIFADQITLSDLYNTARGPLTPDALQGGVVALVSPGLPRGTDPRANLYATMSAGDVAAAGNPRSGLLQRELTKAGAKDVTLIPFGDARSPGRMAALRRLILRLHRNGAAPRAPGVLLVGIEPKLESAGKPSWDSLTPIAWLSCGGGTTDASRQPTLTSDTTQTAGLLALRDIAPTILAAESLPIPDSMSGHPAKLVQLGPGHSRDTLLQSMEQLSEVDHKSLAPFGWIFGLGGGAALLLAVACVARPLHGARPIVRFGLRLLLATPIALLAAALAPPSEPYLYLGEITLISAVFATAPRLSWLLAATSLILVGDAICGAPMVSRSLMSGYWLSGIRFYGIGNEYMGILIGVTLLWPFLETRGEDRPSPLRLASIGLLFAVVLFVLAYPAFGAKAGGAVTAMAAFLPCWRATLQRKGPYLGIWCVSVVLGFAAIFGLTAIAHHFSARMTHIQQATDALAHGRLDYIAHIALRKAKMAVKVALAPGALSGVAGAAVLALLWQRSGLRKRAQRFLESRASLRRALVSGLWGILAAALFNDSGIVAALLLFGCLALCLLHELLGEPECASSLSTSAMFGSESPSATSSNLAPTLSSP